MKPKVELVDSKGRRFRFSEDKVLTSSKVIRFPAMMAGKNVMFESHVVNSGIRLLWSWPSMAKAGVILDLPPDRAQIFGKWINLDLTSIGHYSLRILRTDESLNICLPDLV